MTENSSKEPSNGEPPVTVYEKEPRTTLHEKEPRMTLREQVSDFHRAVSQPVLPTPRTLPEDRVRGKTPSRIDPLQ
jgi:hypothetical protein